MLLSVKWLPWTDIVVNVPCMLPNSIPEFSRIISINCTSFLDKRTTLWLAQGHTVGSSVDPAMDPGFEYRFIWIKTCALKPLGAYSLQRKDILKKTVISM